MALNVQIFGTMKCKDTQKALRFFKERNVKPHFVNLNEKALSKGELNNIKRSVPLEDIIDIEGKEYAKRNLKFIIHDVETEILEHPLLLKTPIVRIGAKSSVGYEPENWIKWME